MEKSTPISNYMHLLPHCAFDGGELKYKSENRILPLSNFLPVPLEEIVYDDGRTQERYFKITAYKLQNENIIKLPETLVRAVALPSMNWVAESWGFEANIEPPIQTKKDYLRSIIFTLGAQTAIRRTVFTHTGWRKVNGRWCFLYHGGAIGSKNVSVELENKLRAYNMASENITTDETVQAVLKLFSVSREQIMYPLMAITFLSPLNEYLRQCGYEPSFLIYLLGRTQTKKSTIAALMLSFFGRFTSTTLPASFKDTENAIEKKGHALKDVLIVIDDFHPVTHYRDRQNMEKIAQSLARGYGDRTGKDRMQADTTIRQGYAPRGNAIITGEDFPAIGQSGSARNFIIELTPEDIKVSNELNSVQAAASRGVLANFMVGYIKWLIPQADDLPAKLKDKFLRFRQKAIEEKVSGFGRTGDIVSWLQIGMESLIDYLVYLEVDFSKSAEKQKDKAWHIFCGLSDTQIEKSEEDKPTNMFIDALKELLESGKLFVKKHPEKTLSGTECKGEMVGYLDIDVYYFLPANVYNAVFQFYKQQGEVFPLTKTRLFKQMAYENLIETEVTGGIKNYTRQKRFGKEKSRYLVIHRDALYG